VAQNSVPARAQGCRQAAAHMTGMSAMTSAGTAVQLEMALSQKTADWGSVRPGMRSGLLRYRRWPGGGLPVCQRRPLLLHQGRPQRQRRLHQGRCACEAQQPCDDVQLSSIWQSAASAPCGCKAMGTCSPALPADTCAGHALQTLDTHCKRIAAASLVFQLLAVVWRLLGQLVAVEYLVFVLYRPSALLKLHQALRKGAVTLANALRQLGIISRSMSAGAPAAAGWHG
jgi:hypothetical protein